MVFCHSNIYYLNFQDDILRTQRFALRAIKGDERVDKSTALSHCRPP